MLHFFLKSLNWLPDCHGFLMSEKLTLTIKEMSIS